MLKPDLKSIPRKPQAINLSILGFFPLRAILLFLRGAESQMNCPMPQSIVTATAVMPRHSAEWIGVPVYREMVVPGASPGTV